MADVKPKVTLIGKELAKNGLEFIYEGTIDDCTSCRLNKACNNLQKGRRYRVVGVRPTEHPCHVHLNGACTVEVIESPTPALVSADMAIRHTKIQFECSCTREDCPNHALCHPDGIHDRHKYTIVDVLGAAPEHCEKGRTLHLVGLMPV